MGSRTAPESPTAPAEDGTRSVRPATGARAWDACRHQVGGTRPGLCPASSPRIKEITHGNTSNHSRSGRNRGYLAGRLRWLLRTISADLHEVHERPEGRTLSRDRAAVDVLQRTAVNRD